MASKKPSAWAITEAWRTYLYGRCGCDAASVRPLLLDIAHALDAARNEGRREREAEIVAWAEKQAAIVRADGTTMLDAAWLAAYQQIGEDIKRGAGRKENDRG